MALGHFIVLALCGFIQQYACILPKFSALPAIHGLAESRQFNFGGFGAGPQFGNRRPFNQFNNNNNQQQQRRPPQQQEPPPPPQNQPGRPGNAGVFQLAVDNFPAAQFQDDTAVLNTINGTLPGVQSGNVVVHPDPLPVKVDVEATVAPLPPNGARCTPATKSDVTGTCANVFDVVINRRCSRFRTSKSDQCNKNEVCCFKVSVDDVVETSFDQVPCGLRRTPELAQRELQRIADEDNLDTIPMRILGGLEAFQNEICWQAAVMVDGKYVCGAAVVNSRHVITAGHCLNDVEHIKQVQVVTGTKDLRSQDRCSSMFEASDIFFNDNYDPRSLVMDLVIIKLSTPITNTNCTCRICLPDGNNNLEASGKLDCLVTGFGTTKPGLSANDVGPLNIGKVAVVVEQRPDQTLCSNRLHASSSIPKNFMIDDSMICAIGEDKDRVTDTCDLDGGSPLVCRMNPDVQDVYTLVGLSSWGLPCGSNVITDATGQTVRIPTVYSHVRPAMKWIEQKTRIA